MQRAVRSALYDNLHEYRDATALDFEGLDLNYYEEVTRDLCDAEGYRFLGDLVNVTIERITSFATPIRVLAAADGSHIVALQHVRQPVGTDRVIEAVSELSDGTFLVSANTPKLTVMKPPPEITQQVFPQYISVHDLVQNHLDERRRLLMTRGENARPILIRTLEDALASEHRQQATKNAFARTSKM